MNALLSLDAAFFQFINTGLSNPVFDALLPWCRERWLWMPFYGFIMAFFLLNYPKKRGFLLILSLVLTVGLADTLSSKVIKNSVQRLRPCNDPALAGSLQLRVPSCGSGFSFTSSHAANHFAVAVFLATVLGHLSRWIRPILLCWAALIAFSQVYVGVHYPLDVLCGGLLGAGTGWFGAKIFNFY
jgi:undecaprenyl-diphosphatase